MSSWTSSRTRTNIRNLAGCMRPQTSCTKKVSKLFDTFRESFAGLTEMEDVVKTDIPTPDPVADSVVRKVLREKIDEICDYLYDIADEESFLISQVDEIKTVLLQQYYVALKK